MTMPSIQQVRYLWVVFLLSLCATFLAIQIGFGIQEYSESEIHFENQSAGLSLSGTLTEPVGKGPFPAMLLISGEGPHDREYGRIFSSIAHRLGRNDVASLRYDRRGVGKSQGFFKNATLKEFSDDAHSAITHLWALDKFSSIGVLGHSEGGLVASIVAARKGDISIVVLMSTPGHSKSRLNETWCITRNEEKGQSRESTEKFLRVYFKLDELIRSGNTDAETKMLVRAIVSKTMNVADVDEEVEILLSPANRFRLDFDPTEHLRQIHCPVLERVCELTPSTEKG